MRGAHGYTLIESILAIAIFSMVAAAVTQTVVWSQRARQLAENWMQATQLATDRIEAVRAGVDADATPQIGIFARDTILTPVAGHRGLMRADVTVTWNDTEPKQFALSTLYRR